MKSNVYESAVLINAGLEDNQIDLIINRIKETISNNGGEIREIENWGRKRLAYVVKKNKLGYYAIFRFDSPPDLISKLERFYQLDENILRYLTISLNSDALEQIEKDKIEEPKLVLEVEEIIPDIVDVEEVDDLEPDNSEIKQ
ncbi:MAG TPA: 30S ribosomal protein S6 [Ignavibacteriaceae bacterium]|nr:30S ribosomal protein S6 [Ignavibacteriaceae bacterium]